MQQKEFRLDTWKDFPTFVVVRPKRDNAAGFSAESVVQYLLFNLYFFNSTTRLRYLDVCTTSSSLSLDSAEAGFSIVYSLHFICVLSGPAGCDEDLVQSVKVASLVKARHLACAGEMFVTYEFWNFVLMVVQ